MATLNDLATAVNDYVTAAKDEAQSKLGTLNIESMSFFSPSARLDIMDMASPALPTGLFITSQAGAVSSSAKQAFDRSVAGIVTRATAGQNAIAGLKLPPEFDFHDTPLAEWVGPDENLSNLWEDNKELVKTQWKGDAVKEVYNLIEEVKKTVTAPSDNITSLNNSISDGANALFRTSTNARLAGAAQTELQQLLKFKSNDTERTAGVMLEEYANNQYVTAVRQGLSVDRIVQMFSITFGEIYAKITDILLGKALKESGWFIRDFKARAEMAEKSASLNSSMYLDTLKSALDIITTEAATNIKAVTTNFEIATKAAAATYGFEKIDLMHQLDSVDIDLSIFKAQVDDLLQQGLEAMDEFMANHSQRVGAMVALAHGYASLVQTSSQGTVAVAQAKG